MSGFIQLFEELISFHYYFLETDFYHNKGLHVPEKKILHEIQNMYLRERESVGHTMMAQIQEANLEILALKTRPT